MPWGLQWLSALVRDAVPPTYRIGRVGPGAIVQQGQYLVNVQVTDAQGAEDLLRRMERLKNRRYVGPNLRKLDPIVLVNRRDEISAIKEYFEVSSASLLFLVGLPGIGKSTLARGALEFRHEQVSALWITCEGLTIDVLLAQLNFALRLDADKIIDDKEADAKQKTVEILSCIASRCIIVFDGFEALIHTDDEFKSKEIGSFFSSAVEFDHPAKLLATTRRLPAGFGKGGFASDVYKVGGLSLSRAKQLFGLRAGMSDEQIDSEIPPAVFERLQGHPKFVELLAMASHELPIPQLVKRVEQASDIGEYVQKEIIERLSQAEYRALASAVVFRHAFSVETLTAVYGELNKGTRPGADTLRSLSRRAILDRADNEHYFLHPILGEAMKLSPAEEASAHAAAARCMLPDHIDPADYSNWEEGLFHLRRAAETGKSEGYYRPYYDFVTAHWGAWNWAGWPRRSVDELRVVAGLATEPQDQFLAYYQLSLALDKAGDDDEALETIRNLVTGLDELPKVPTTDQERELCNLAGLIKLRIGLTSVKPGSVDEARRMADDVELWIEVLKDAHLCSRYWELRFAIARRSEPLDPVGMLKVAEKYFAAVENSLEDHEDPNSSDTMAEAHFAVGLSNLYLGNVQEGAKHLMAQLRIKREKKNMPGVAAGLWSYGVIVHGVSIVDGGAALITSDQMFREMGITRNSKELDSAANAVGKFKSDTKNIKRGRELIENIAPEVVDYYERGLRYWNIVK